MSLVENIIGVMRGKAGKPIPGGIKPPDYKQATLRSRLMPTPIPRELILPLTKHGSTRSKPLVKPGDKVLKYQPIACSEATGIVDQHAPTSGVIRAIENFAIPSPLNKESICIFLKSDGFDAEIDQNAITDYRSLSYLELANLIEEGAIFGLSGEGYINHLKLSSGKAVKLLIINAAENEPYITADEALLREKAKLVVLGAKILQVACMAERCVIAIDSNKTDAIEALEQTQLNFPIELIKVAPKYPTGSEKQLIQAITSKEVPSGKCPADIGILMHNVGTAYAAYQAVVEGKPCISRITTLAGPALQTPKNFETLIGTSVDYLLELCGLNQKDHTMTLMGGPLMGIKLARTDVPILKTTNCIIAASNTEFPSPALEQACIRCGFCANACPVSLLPQQLYLYAKCQHYPELISHGLNDCIECGACEYVCPSNIPLVQYYRASKEEIGNQLKNKFSSAQWKQRFQYHQYRVKKDKEASRESKKRGAAAKTDEAIQSAESTVKNTLPTFSRESAKKEIAAAVDRARKRKTRLIASNSDENTESSK
jgi:electron transport complex protein RnfC